MEIKKHYQVVIIGGGIMGLSTAYNLARRGMREIAVFERGVIGLGASSRNTELIRSAFSTHEWVALFEQSLRLWYTLSAELQYNVFFVPRGYLILGQTEAHQELLQHAHQIQQEYSIGSQFLSPAQAQKLVPALNLQGVSAAIYQPRGGTAHHDAVVWGYASAARRLGVDIFSFTPVESLIYEGGKVRGVVIKGEEVSAQTVVNAAGGHSLEIAAMAGLNLPVEQHRVEAFATEPVKPFIRPAVVALQTSTYFSQTYRGEIVGGTGGAPDRQTDQITSTLHFLERVARNFLPLIPAMRAMRLMRQWAGVVDGTEDHGPIMGMSGVDGLILTCGWGGYGFMGCPIAGQLVADLIITGKESPLMQPFHVGRFATGKVVHEGSLMGSSREMVHESMPNE